MSLFDGCGYSVPNSILQSFPALKNGSRRMLNSSVASAQQAGFGKVLVLLTPLAVGAGVVSYAKYVVPMIHCTRARLKDFFFQI